MEESFGDSLDDFIDRRIKPHGKEDRISTLPDSIIQHILSFLPSTEEAIRTSILSKTWRNKWTHVPVLIFIAPRRGCDDYYRYIENTLVLHESPKLKKFHLEYDYCSHPDHQFTSKIRFAVRKCVEELLLICDCASESFLLPEFLFDNAFLVHLEMVNCYFLPKWRVNWPSLKSMMISCSALSEYDCSQGIGNVVSGSPLLESLELRGYMHDDITIVSKSLVTLTFIDVEVSAAIKISCPNLVEFSVVANGFDKLVVASESLEVLSLVYVDNTVVEVSCPNLAKFDFFPFWDEIFQAVKVSCPSSTCTTLDYEYPPEDHNSVMELLEQFQHVNKLTIGTSFFKMISDLDVEVRLSLPLLNSKYMTLNVGGYFGLAIPGITYALRSPNLDTLVIKLDSKFHQETLHKDLQDLIISRLNYWNSNESTGFTCLMSNLKTMKITGLCEKDNKCKLALEFIEFLLKKARVLEKIILLLEEPGPFFVNEVSQELLSFPRYSPHAIVRLLST